MGDAEEATLRDYVTQFSIALFEREAFSLIVTWKDKELVDKWLQETKPKVEVVVHGLNILKPTPETMLRYSVHKSSNFALHYNE